MNLQFKIGLIQEDYAPEDWNACTHPKNKRRSTRFDLFLLIHDNIPEDFIQIIITVFIMRLLPKDTKRQVLLLQGVG